MLVKGAPGYVTVAYYHIAAGIKLILAYWGQDKMTDISQTIFSGAFFKNYKIWILTKMSLTFVPKGPTNKIPALVQIMAWRQPDDKPLSGPMMGRLLTHICYYRCHKSIFQGPPAYDENVIWIRKFSHIKKKEINMIYLSLSHRNVVLIVIHFVLWNT